MEMMQDSYYWLTENIGLPIMLAVVAASVVFPTIYYFAKSFGAAVS